MKDTSLEAYNYQIPKNLIAQKPSPNRDDSKLFIINRQTQSFSHTNFRDLLKELPQNCALVLNNAKVIPSRIFGKKESGGKVEVLFLYPHRESGIEKRDCIFSVLMKPFISAGRKVFFEDGYQCEVISKEAEGKVKVKFNKGDILDFLQNKGIMPLPPYINRKATRTALTDNLSLTALDKERYQTSYAEKLGAIAAPTAGLHFTEKLLSEIESAGIPIIKLTLYVGWGTFKPIVSSEISKHQMPSETFEIDGENAKKLNNALMQNRKIIAVGTTTTRALEFLAQKRGMTSGKKQDNILQIESFIGETNIFIYPGYNFQIIGGLITNFHMPKSTPLMLASAFSSRETILKAYKEAIERQYRFFSYGDAMLIL